MDEVFPRHALPLSTTQLKKKKKEYKKKKSKS